MPNCIICNENDSYAKYFIYDKNEYHKIFYCICYNCVRSCFLCKLKYNDNFHSMYHKRPDLVDVFETIYFCPNCYDKIDNIKI